MGFGIQKYELLNNLENIRESFYVYMGDFCDCKYGYIKSPRFSNEATGCPEIRQAMSMIYVLTDEEFVDICKRARIMIT